MSNGGKDQEKKRKKNLSVLVQEWDIPKKKGSTWLLKSQKCMSRSVFSINIIIKIIAHLDKLAWFLTSARNPIWISFVTDGLYIAVPDAWLNIWNGSFEITVFVYLYVYNRCVALLKLICQRLYLISLKEIKHLHK